MQTARWLINLFVPAGERDRLEGDGLNLIDVSNGKIDNIADIVIVDAVDDRVHQSDFHSYPRHVFDRLKFYVEEIADTAMLVLFLRRSIKLQIGAVQTRLFGLANEVGFLGETDAVRRSKHAVESDFFRVSDCVQKVRRQRRLAAGKENDDLPARF